MLKFLFGLVLVAAFAWFGATVTLGSHTLFGHLQAISHTKESQDLLDGTKKSAQPLVDDVRRRIAGTPEAKAEEKPVEAAVKPDPGPPQQTISTADRPKLLNLLGHTDHNAVHR